jgi:hypothetical protein
MTTLYCLSLEQRMSTALQRNLDLCIPRKGIAQPQSQFSHSRVCERSIYSHFGPSIFLHHNRQTDQGNILIAHRNMKVGFGTVAAQFLFLEYLFPIFGIVSLQCFSQYWQRHYLQCRRMFKIEGGEVAIIVGRFVL